MDGQRGPAARERDRPADCVRHILSDGRLLRRRRPVRGRNRPANGRPDSTVDAVSCPSAVYCVAAGYYHTNPYGQVEAILLTRSDGAWTAAQAPLPANAAVDSPPDAVAQNATVAGVACPSTSYCAAVGFYEDTTGAVDNLLLTWSGKTWTATQASLSSDGISCLSASYCTATNDGDGGPDNTGDFATDGSGLLTWSGGAWSPDVVPLPANAAKLSGLSGASCPSATYCVAVGSYFDSSNNQDALLLTSSG
jgi:hypothetical protein